MSERREPTAKDLAEMRDEAMGNVAFSHRRPSPRGMPPGPPPDPARHDVGLGHTEVREQLCAALEALTQ